jgi:hypothetical protein
MRKIDAAVAAELWNRFRGEPLRMIALFINSGVRPERGKTKKESLTEVLGEITKSAYTAGLQQGYDMGHAVFGVQPPPPPDGATVGDAPSAGADILETGPATNQP